MKIILFSCLVYALLFGQNLVTIPNTVERSIVSGQIKCNLHIALPYGYGKSDKTYPTVYLLDSNTDFPLVTSISRRLEAEDDLDKFIIVGLSYQDSTWYNRRRDYTPSNAHNRKRSGGAPKFLSFIEEHVVPLIEKEFSVTNSRTLLGHSLGGLFASYLLINNNKTFDQYIISSPSLWWDNFSVLENINSTYDKKSIFISVGASENPHMIESSEQLNKFTETYLKSSSKKRALLDGENHASAKFRAYADGLRWLFKD
jgi:predicted alpha/beta superfamily hydrolase